MMPFVSSYAFNLPNYILKACPCVSQYGRQSHGGDKRVPRRARLIQPRNVTH